MCDCCDIVRSLNPNCNQYSLGCVYCGSRVIQALGKMQIGTTECRDRRRSNLADWVARGHSEAEIRALAKGGVAVAPEVEEQGLEKSGRKK